MGARGPKTAAGRAAVRLNAVQHGVLSTTPVIPGLEREEDWKAHREGVLAALSVEGQVETDLAELVVWYLWRLQRVVRFERDAVVMAQREAEKDYFLEQRTSLADPLSLEQAPGRLKYDQECVNLLERFSRLPDGTTLSDEEADVILQATFEAAKVDQTRVRLCDVPDSEAWTAGSVRKAVKAIASYVGKDPDDVVSAALGNAKAHVRIDKARISRATEDVERLRRWHLLPEEEILNKTIRYESHLNRALYQALHELEALQARRRGLLAPLARLEVHGLPEG